MPSPLDLALAWRRTKADLQANRVFVRMPCEIELVEENLDGWLNQLNQKIAAGYHPSSAPIADIPKGNGAVRPAAILSLEDRTVYAALVGALLPEIYSGLRWAQGTVDFSYQLSGNLSSVGWLRNRFLNWRRFRRVQTDKLAGERVSHVVISDLTGFYENIDLEILMSDLRALGCDVGKVQILQTCLRRWGVIPGRGIPQGYSASDILAKVYLHPVDRAMIDEGFDYIRYVDDIRLFCSSFTDCKKSLMFITQVLRGRGLNMQTSKTEMIRKADAAGKIEGITPVIEAAQERYKKEIAEIVGHIDPYAPISEIEVEVDPEEAPIEALLDVFKQYFTDEGAQFSGTLFHFLLHRLAAQSDQSAVEFCLRQLPIRPQETQPVLDYFDSVGARDRVYPTLAEFLRSDDCIYDYQTYQIFHWLGSGSVAPTPELTSIARQLTFDPARPSYLRAVCRRVLQEYGSIADVERLERSFAGALDDLEAAQILVSLKRMEAGRRNAFYGRVTGGGVLCSRAARLVRQARL
jgi:hypothetical protein